MNRTRTKLCGMMNAADARAAADAGADAIGMILHADARRRIDLDTAAEIVTALPPYVTPVGVFVNAPTHLVLEIATKLRLVTVQFHGHETAEDIAAVSPLKVIKAVRVAPETIRASLEKLLAQATTNLAALLLETDTAGVSGGSGVENDFGLIAQLIAEQALVGLPPVIISGGLTPQNVAEVVRLLHPYAVDVSSGIEAEYGKKSADKMRAFVTNAGASS
ncbi:MAG: phosphoribosylanthranilate isomerase [Burkholderiales bacterium]|nr:phosphoribosylanthranilate isomerase [Phycisphaerae bacterium]